MEDRGIIGQLNPAFKLATHGFFMLLLTIISDPFTSFLLMLIPLIITFTMLRLPAKILFTTFVSFLFLFFLSTWSLAAFGRGETLWFQWAWFHFTKEGLMNGLTIGFRMLAFLYYGFIFIMTTNPTSFVLSLMQQFRLRPKWAYALLAGIRFLPLFHQELAQIRAAHRVRGVHRATSLRERLQTAFRFTIPLLAQGIRKAERVAIALEARGFDGSWNRTFYRTTPWGRRDIIYFVVLLLAHGLLIGLSTALGIIRWGLV